MPTWMTRIQKHCPELEVGMRNEEAMEKIADRLDEYVKIIEELVIE